MGTPDPLGVLVGRQAAVRRGSAQQRHDPVAVCVGGSQVTRARPVCHPLKILQPQVTGGSGNGPET